MFTSVELYVSGAKEQSHAVSVAQTVHVMLPQKQRLSIISVTVIDNISSCF